MLLDFNGKDEIFSEVDRPIGRTGQVLLQSGASTSGSDGKVKNCLLDRERCQEVDMCVMSKTSFLRGSFLFLPQLAAQKASLSDMNVSSVTGRYISLQTFPCHLIYWSAGKCFLFWVPAAFSRGACRVSDMGLLAGRIFRCFILK